MTQANQGGSFYTQRSYRGPVGW